MTETERTDLLTVMMRFSKNGFSRCCNNFIGDSPAEVLAFCHRAPTLVENAFAGIVPDRDSEQIVEMTDDEIGEISHLGKKCNYSS